MRIVQQLTRFCLLDLWINKAIPKVELLPLLCKNWKVFIYSFHIVRKLTVLLFNLNIIIRTQDCLLGLLALRLILHDLTLFFKFIIFFHFNEVFLSVGSYLCTGSGFNKILDLFPIFSIKFEAIEKLFMLFPSPSAVSFGLFKC